MVSIFRSGFLFQGAHRLLGHLLFRDDLATSVHHILISF